MGFVRFVVIFIVAYLLISLITRYVIPVILRLFFRYMSNRSRNRHFKNRTKGNRKEGEVKIDYAPGKSKRIDKDTGEYVDYEEVDD